MFNTHVDAWYKHNIKVVGPNRDAKFWGVSDMFYQATWGDYDLDCKVGYGSTPDEAASELLSQMED